MKSSSSASDPSISVLFVCLGNICRSPLAEGVFRHLAEVAGLEHRLRIDSAGTGDWHTGSPPDPRSIQVAREQGISLEGYARTLNSEDFHHFDLLIAMDQQNLDQIRSLAGNADPLPSIFLLRAFDPEAGAEEEVPDPYYGDIKGFREVFDIVDRSCRSLLEWVREHHL